jgi:hypothetical protein
MALAVFLSLALTLCLLYLGSRASGGSTRRFFDGAGAVVVVLMGTAALWAASEVPSGITEPRPPRGDVKKLIDSGQSKADAEALARRIDKASGGDPCVKRTLLTAGEKNQLRGQDFDRGLRVARARCK